MENEKKRNQEILISHILKNQNYISYIINKTYKLRNYFYCIFKDFYLGNSSGIRNNYEKIYETIKSIKTVTYQFQKFYDQTILFNFPSKDLSVFFNIQAQVLDLIDFIYTDYLIKPFLNSILLLDILKEMYKNKLKNNYKYIYETFQSKKHDFVERFKLKNNLIDIDQRDQNRLCQTIIKESFQNLKIKFLQKNQDEIPIKVSIKLKNSFTLLLYVEDQNVKLTLGGPKERFSICNNNLLKIQKMNRDNNPYSRFLIYNKLKRILMEKLEIILNVEPFIQLYYFCNILGAYSNLFKKKCNICNKITKFNPVENIFYPPLIFHYENTCSNFSNEKFEFFHEDCYLTFMNQ